MKTQGRPISPHITIYTPLITSMSSIIGRFAGIFVYLISAFLLLSMAFAIQSKQNVGILLEYAIAFYSKGSVFLAIAVLLTFGALYAFFLYLLAIVRHLIWDFGFCLDLKISKVLGYAMFGLAFVFSVLTTAYIYLG